MFLPNDPPALTLVIATHVENTEHQTALAVFVIILISFRCSSRKRRRPFSFQVRSSRT